MTPTQLLHEIHDQLLPQPDRVEVARDRALRLIEAIHQRAPAFFVRKHHAFGSIARGTALASFADIDYLLLLDAATLEAEISNPTPKKVLPRLAAWAEQARAGIASRGYLEARPQRHSVGVTYIKSELRIDLVPALRFRGQQHFHIPSMDDEGWIPTHPHRIQALIDDAQPRLKKMIRLLKGWRRARGRNRGWYVPGYGLELFVLHGPWRDRPPTTPLFEIMRDVFATLGPADGRQRLTLLGKGEAPVVLIDPWTRENLAGANDRESKGNLIAHARLAAARLEEAAGATEAAARRILSDLFIGDRWR